MRIAVTIRTANRAPHKNYLGATVRQLLAQGVNMEDIHIAATDPDVAWLARELSASTWRLDVPAAKRTPNENGLAQIAMVEPSSYDWILLLEDDLEFCADFLGSVERWLERYARADRHVYRFFGFNVPSRPKAAYDVRLERIRASQAQALRMADALDFLAWGRAHLHDWPLQTAWGRAYTDHWRGFDKLVASWALTRWPGQPALASHPQFVRHVGQHSSIHARTAWNDAAFAGRTWSFL